ncbi:MAG: putative lipid II flippase FtsW [Casimicrobiaceae bacterium]|nr:putative lipid II flippase FtsW [Casimicrobiaceae bacterium]
MIAQWVTQLRERWIGRPHREEALRLEPEIDVTLLIVLVALLALGLLMVYSASIPIASVAKATQGNPFYYLQRQALFVLLGLALAVFVFDVPVRLLERLAPLVIAVALGLLALVLVPSIGKVVNGARRWIPLGPFSLQPSEIMKLAVVLFAARYAVRKAERLSSKQPLLQSILHGLGPFLLVMLFAAVLLLREPDFGATLIVVTTGIVILFMAGLDHRVIVPLAVLAVAAGVALVATESYRLERIMTLLDPWKEEYRQGYQLTTSLIAIGRGGVFGLGLGASVSKHYYLPEAHTDFILAITAEELGLVGLLLVIAAYAFITVRAFRIGRDAERLEQPFAAGVARGIGVLLGGQALINIAVNLGLAPTKGLTLPLMSYGGSGMVVTLCALAILLRIDWENRRRERGFAV